MLDEKRIQEIKERAEWATQGPWGGDGVTINNWPSGSEQPYVLMEWIANGNGVVHENDEPYVNHENDSSFMAHAREDIPFLLQTIEDLRSAEQGGWIAVSSGQFPQEDERVAVWIVDDNTAFGGEKREYDDIWAYDSRHVGWQNGWVAYWRKRPAPPAAPKKENA